MNTLIYPADHLRLMTILVQRTGSLLTLDRAIFQGGQAPMRAVLSMVTEACEADESIREAVSEFDIPALLQQDWIAMRAQQSGVSA